MGREKLCELNAVVKSPSYVVNRPTTSRTVYGVRCTVYSVQCTVYCVRCAVYDVQYIVYSVQYTVYKGTHKAGQLDSRNQFREKLGRAEERGRGGI